MEFYIKNALYTKPLDSREVRNTCLISLTQTYTQREHTPRKGEYFVIAENDLVRGGDEAVTKDAAGIIMIRYDAPPEFNPSDFWELIAVTDLVFHVREVVAVYGDTPYLIRLVCDYQPIHGENIFTL